MADFGTVATALHLARVLVQYAAEVKDAPVDMKELLEKIKRSAELLQSIENRRREVDQSISKGQQDFELN